MTKEIFSHKKANLKLKNKDVNVVSEDFDDSWHPRSEREALSEEFYDVRFTTAEWRARYCDALLQFASDPKNLYTLDFCKEYHFDRNQMQRLKDRHPEIAKAHVRFLMMIGLNRVHYVKTHPSAGIWLAKDMHRYDPEWDENNKYNALMKKIEALAEDKPAIVNVFVDGKQTKLANPENHDS